MNKRQDVTLGIIREDIQAELEQFVNDHPQVDIEDAVQGMVRDWLAGYRWAAPPYSLHSTFTRWKGKGR